MITSENIIKQTPESNLDRYYWNNPGTVLARNSQIINTETEIWTVDEEFINNQINWNLMLLPADIKDSMKAFIFHKIETTALISVSSMYEKLKYASTRMQHLNSLNDLTYAELLKLLNSEGNRSQESTFGIIRRWYKWCSRQEIQGFDRDIEKRIAKLKLSGNSSGQAVLSRNVNKGSFDDAEFNLIRKVTGDKKVNLTDRVCVMLLLELGARPSQIVLLNEEDFKIIVSPEGIKFYSINVRRMKQGDTKRSQQKNRRITEELGVSIKQLIENNKIHCPDLLSKRPLLFGYTYKYKTADGKIKIGTKAIKRRLTTPAFTERIRNFSTRNNIVSPTTGKLISMYPYRFRYTFAIRHANQGTPASVLAEMLDHSLLNSVRNYIKGTGEMVEHLNNALGKNEQFVSTINRFIGKTADKTNDEKNVIIGTVPTLKNIGEIGVCGANFLCNLYPPLSCYACSKFIAWKEAPHEQMLFELESHVTKLLEKSGNTTDRIPMQLKETILSIKALLLKLNTEKPVEEVAV